MDALQLIRKQTEQDSKIVEVTNEVTLAKTDSDGTQFNTLKERIDNIKTGIVKVFRRSETLTGNVASVPVGIKDYDVAKDYLSVYLNGVRLVETVEFTLDAVTSSVSPVKGTWQLNDLLLFEVFKNSSVAGVGGITTIEADKVTLPAPIAGGNTVQEALTNINQQLSDAIPIVYSDVEPVNAANGTIWINPTIAIP